MYEVFGTKECRLQGDQLDSSAEAQVWLTGLGEESIVTPDSHLYIYILYGQLLVIATTPKSPTTAPIQPVPIALQQYYPMTLDTSREGLADRTVGAESLWECRSRNRSPKIILYFNVGQRDTAHCDRHLVVLSSDVELSIQLCWNNCVLGNYEQIPIYNHL